MRYISNKETGEIHDRNSAGERCNLDDSKHTNEISLTELEELIRKAGFDLCDWCFGDQRWGQWVTSPCTADTVTSSPDSA
jgi:hypothetical protein